MGGGEQSQMKSSTRAGEVTRGVRLLKSPQGTTIAGGGGG